MVAPTDRRSVSVRGAIVISLLAAAYVGAQILADVSSLKITDVVAGLSMDGGTLVYPFTFTIRDLIHKVAGKHVARALIFAAAAINLFMAGLFWVVARLPATPGSGPSTDLFGDVLAPVWRIVIASIIAEVVAELIDTEVYAAWVRRFGRRIQWGRVLSSNAVAVPIDSVLFAVVAFGGVLSAGVVAEIVFTNILLKGAVTVASLPLIYLVRPEPVISDEPLEPAGP